MLQRKVLKEYIKAAVGRKAIFFCNRTNKTLFYTKDKLKRALFVSLQVLFTLTEIELNSLRSVEQNVRQSETASRKS